MAIHILTDSTSDITQELAKEMGIILVPLTVTFGEETFYDGVTIDSQKYYERLRNEKNIPTTAQPAPGDFVEAIKREANPGDTIICVHISSKLSGTLGSCKIAAEMLGDDYKFEIVDSFEACSSLGLIVLRLAKMVRDGASFEELMAAVPKMIEKSRFVFAVGTLKFLEKNGRIGKASSYLGGLLNIKLIIELADGAVAPVDKIRGNIDKLCESLVAYLVKEYGDVPLEVVFVDSDMPDYSQAIQTAAAGKLNIVASHTAALGPVIGSHCGPLTVGMAVLPIDL